MTLKKFQNSFSTHILTPHGHTHVPLISGLGDQPLRMQVYQNNVYSSLIEILKERYPTVLAIVGNEFFTVLCQQYVTAQPPNTPVMLNYGESFPDFIEQHKDKHNIVYLSDIASIESARHNAYYAKDDTHLAPEIIANIPIETLLASCITLIPSAKLIQSEYSVYTIWEHVNQSDGRLNTDITCSENIFIFKKDLGIQTLLLTKMHAYFFHLLLNKNTLGQALEKLIECDSEENIEPTEVISFLIHNALIENILSKN